MTLFDLQLLVNELCHAKGYSDSVQTLFIGATEEMGELAQAILLTRCNDYVASERKRQIAHLESIPHEIGDIITYLLAICNRLEIEPKIHLVGKWAAWGS